MLRRVVLIAGLIAICVALVALNSAGSRDASRRSPGDVGHGVRLENLHFGGGATDYVDVQFPVARPVGVIVWFHGGGWIAGSRRSALTQDIPQWLVQRGWVLATFDYRLTTAAPDGSTVNAFPAAVADGQRAARWMTLNVRRFGIPPVVVLAGVSAGGAVALASAVATSDVTKVDGAPPAVDGVLSIAGPTDVRALYRVGAPIFSAAAALYGGCDVARIRGDAQSCALQEEFWRKAQMAGITWNVIHAAAAGLELPPVYLIGGARDTLVDPVDQIDPIVDLWRTLAHDERFAQSDVVFDAGHNLTTRLIDSDRLSAWLDDIASGNLAASNPGATRQRLREVRL